MTGFGRAEVGSGGRSTTVEVRSVNNRYLGVKLKLPSRFLAAEPRLEELVRGAVSRGSVDVFVRVRSPARREAAVVDTDLARAYLTSIRRLQRDTKLAGEPALDTVLGLPGVVTLEESYGVEPTEVRDVETALKRALKQLTATRAEEGGRLKAELLGILGAATEAALAIEARAPKVPVQHKRRLTQRIAHLMEGSRVTLDPGLLEKEVAVFADRCDITEELARLRSHFRGFKTALNKRGPIGRSLDFLVQEMGREANTIGSKNQDVTLGRHVIDLKSQIERLREQVQNIE